MTDEAPPKVVTMHGFAAPEPGRVMPSVVARLEQLLESARAGELVGIMGVMLYADGATGSMALGHSSRAQLGSMSILMQTCTQTFIDNGG